MLTRLDIPKDRSNMIIFKLSWGEALWPLDDGRTPRCRGRSQKSSIVSWFMQNTDEHTHRKAILTQEVRRPRCFRPPLQASAAMIPQTRFRLQWGHVGSGALALIARGGVRARGRAGPRRAAIAAHIPRPQRLPPRVLRGALLPTVVSRHPVVESCLAELRRCPILRTLVGRATASWRAHKPSPRR
jgi:hypothetical protein